MALLDDENEPRRPSTRVERPPFDRWNVADLRLYIDELADEIRRAEAAIAQKDAARGHADQFFRKT